MTKQISPQDSSTPIVDRRGMPTIAFFNLIVQLTNLEVIDGEGDPNGVILAKEKTMYWNRTNNTLWFKTSGPNLLTGWLQMSTM